MLKVEAELRAALKASAKLATGAASGTGQELLDSAARNLNTLLALTIALGRARARNGSHERLVGELKAATPDDEDEEYQLQRTDSEEEDESRSALVALSFASYWLLSATKAHAEGEAVETAIATANAKQAHRVRMIAATETSTAFNLERSEALKQAARRGPVARTVLEGTDEFEAARAAARAGARQGADELEAARRGPVARVMPKGATPTGEAGRRAAKDAGKAAARTAATAVAESEAARDLAQVVARTQKTPDRLVLFKIWDAELDGTTCDDCADAHGTMVPADEDFPQGTPGSVHPNCRCCIELVLLPWWQAIAA